MIIFFFEFIKSIWLIHFIDTDTIDLIVPEFTDNNNENNELEDIR